MLHAPRYPPLAGRPAVVLWPSSHRSLSAQSACGPPAAAATRPRPSSSGWRRPTATSLPTSGKAADWEPRGSIWRPITSPINSANSIATALKTDLWNGGPFQKFQVAVDAELGPNNHLALVGPPKGKSGKPRKIELVLGKDYTPLAISGNGKFDLPLVFAGYGITARKANYDDFAGVDVAGKAAVMLRHQPRDEVDDKESAAIKETAYTAFRHKASNACEHDAAAVIFCSDQAEVRRRRGKDDTLLSFHVAGTTFTHPDLPVINCRRAVIDAFSTISTEPALGEIEDQIDRTLKPASRELKGWRIQGETDVRHVHCEVKNVAAILPGEGPLADEAIVLGAHYDHLGYGSHSTLPSKRRADLSRGRRQRLGRGRGAGGCPDLGPAAAEAPPHGGLHPFHGRGMGLLGQQLLCERSDRAHGQDRRHGQSRHGRPAPRRRLDGQQRGHGHGLRRAAGPGQSAVRIPSHEGRRRFGPQRPGLVLREAGARTSTSSRESIPTITVPPTPFAMVNIPGMRRIAGYVLDMTVALADAPQRPDFVAVPMQRRAGEMPRPFLGCVPDFTREEPGYPISAVISGSPADRCGLRGGDVIVKFGKHHIGICDDFDDALQQYAAGDRVKVRVRRKSCHDDLRGHAGGAAVKLRSAVRAGDEMLSSYPLGSVRPATVPVSTVGQCGLALPRARRGSGANKLP